MQFWFFFASSCKRQSSHHSQLHIHTHTHARTRSHTHTHTTHTTHTTHAHTHTHGLTRRMPRSTEHTHRKLEFIIYVGHYYFTQDTAINIMGPNYIPGKKEHFFPRKKILGMLLFAGLRQEPVESVSLCFLSTFFLVHMHTAIHQ